MIGKKFQMPEDIKNEIREIVTVMASAKTAMDYHARKNYETNQKLWRALRDKMPELDLANYNYHLDHETLEITCIGALQKPVQAKVPAGNDQTPPSVAKN